MFFPFHPKQCKKCRTSRSITHLIQGRLLSGQFQHVPSHVVREHFPFHPRWSIYLPESKEKRAAVVFSHPVSSKEERRIPPLDPRGMASGHFASHSDHATFFFFTEWIPPFPFSLWVFLGDSGSRLRKFLVRHSGREELLNVFR
ncbi:hypothetical protein NPIL_415661 [Nephila pilipes]|uniref:Uncharacterized protein n=1 Tax=Nephila pilipes TaxID=299642 RepID=A0A8X6P0M3_NEPPI|nr:hypothetical protein NPIL_415661 [Nephila pilipes]